MTYYDFVKEYMEVDECKSNRKYSSAGHTFSTINSVRKKVISILHYFYIMKK